MLFRYWAARWKHPGEAAKRYIQAGLGLESRARQLSPFWSEHLSRTRAAQARWAPDAAGNLLTVLGAGPMLDLNLAALQGYFRKFRFVDANPLLVSDWMRLEIQVDPLITDLTNCVDNWLKKVKAVDGSWLETLDVIRDLGRTPVAAYADACDGLISLNVLSQLEIGWQEALEPMLQKQFGKRFVKQKEQEWLAAIAGSGQALIEQHLAALEASAAPNILLISDVEYVEYTGRMYERDRLEPAPLCWTPAGWQADAAVDYEVLPALQSINLDEETLQRWMPSYKVMWHEYWLWHIAPNGTEKTKFGRMHRVGAFALSLCGLM